MGGRPWTQQEHDALADYIESCRGAPDWGEAEKRTGRKAYACSVRASKMRAGPLPIQAPIRRGTPQIAEVLDLPPRPFTVEVPAPAPSKDVPGVTVVLTDTHVPYHDQPSLDVVYAIIEKAKPQLVIHLGDLLDCYRISKYDKDPNRLETLQDEIDQARVVLHQIAQVAPTARRVLLEGNHEDRLRRVIWSLQGAQAEIVKLRKVRQTLNWPTLLELDAIGWEFRPYQGQARAEPVLPHLIVKHGTVVRKWSAFTAKGEWEKYGKGGISGHTHRAGLFYHRDHNGSHAWIEAGCTCTLLPDYMTDDPDWHQGCVVITHDGDRFGVEPVYIQDGVGVWRGERYEAKRRR